MVSLGEDELICDLAETYGIYDMRSLPVRTVAILAYGLGPDSRIKRKIAIAKKEDDVNLDTLLRARMVDLLAILAWQRTKDGMKGRNFPPSMVEMLLNKNKPEHKELRSFKTADDFQRAWKAGGGG